MTSEQDGQHDNWLHAEVFHCLGCGERLFRVDLSPMADEYHFSCDRCANRVDSSWYDHATLAIDRDLERENATDSGWGRELVKLRRIEARLRLCDCGGSYRYDAPRRCPMCNAIAAAEWPGRVDLMPSAMWWEEDRDPTPEELEIADAYFTLHVRQRDIWRTDTSRAASGDDGPGG